MELNVNINFTFEEGEDENEQFPSPTDGALGWLVPQIDQAGVNLVLPVSQLRETQEKVLGDIRSWL